MWASEVFRFLRSNSLKSTAWVPLSIFSTVCWTDGGRLSIVRASLVSFVDAWMPA
jgi:hypothetical protein